MDTIKTASGKTFNTDFVVAPPSSPQACLRVYGVSLVEAATVFGNREETIQMWYGNQYLAMYTKLEALIPEGDAIKVILAKE